MTIYRSNTRIHTPLMTASAAFNLRPSSNRIRPSSGELTKRSGLKKGQRFSASESASPPTKTTGWNSRICTEPSKPSSCLRTLPITKYPAGAAQQTPRDASILFLPMPMTPLPNYRMPPKLRRLPDIIRISKGRSYPRRKASRQTESVSLRSPSKLGCPQGDCGLTHSGKW